MPTEKEAVLDRLRRQKAAEDLIDVQALREEWLKATSDLMSLLGSWLSEAHEERLGTYQVPAVRLTTPKGETIRIAPKARQVVGGYGRVDLERPPGKTILVRTDTDPDVWQFARLLPEAGGWATCLLTEESFWQAIGALI